MSFVIADRSSRFPKPQRWNGFDCSTLNRPLAGTRSLRGHIKVGDTVGLIYEAKEPSAFSVVMSDTVKCEYLLDDDAADDKNATTTSATVKSVVGKNVDMRGNNIESVPCVYKHAEEHICRVVEIKKKKEKNDEKDENTFVLSEIFFDGGCVIHKEISSAASSTVTVAELDTKRLSVEKLVKGVREGRFTPTLVPSFPETAFKALLDQYDHHHQLIANQNDVVQACHERGDVVDSVGKDGNREALLLRARLVELLGPRTHVPVIHQCTRRKRPRIAPPLFHTTTTTNHNDDDAREELADLVVPATTAPAATANDKAVEKDGQKTAPTTIEVQLRHIFRVYSRNDPSLRFPVMGDATRWGGVIVEDAVRRRLAAGNVVRLCLQRKCTDVDYQSDEEEGGDDDGIDYSQSDAEENDLSIYSTIGEKNSAAPFQSRAPYAVILRVLPPAPQQQHNASLVEKHQLEKEGEGEGEKEEGQNVLLCQLYNCFNTDYEDIVMPIPAECVCEVPMEWEGNENVRAFDKEREEMGEGYFPLMSAQKKGRQFVTVDLRGVDIFDASKGI